MDDKSYSNKRRNFLIGSAAAVLVPKMLAPKMAQAASNDYGIVGMQAPELKVSQIVNR